MDQLVFDLLKQRAHGSNPFCSKGIFSHVLAF